MQIMHFVLWSAHDLHDLHDPIRSIPFMRVSGLIHSSTMRPMKRRGPAGSRSRRLIEGAEERQDC